MTARARPAIAPARPVDAAMLALIHAFSFRDGEDWSPDAMALTLGLPGAFGFVAAGAGLILARAAADEAEVLTLAVAPPSRRQGLGTALLEAAKSEARRRGAAALFLEVSTRNADARRLYARTGFIEVGQRPRYYADGTDALLLRAQLGPAPLSRGGAAGG